MGQDGRDDVIEAVRLLHRASAAVGPEDPDASLYRYNLALALQHRYDAIGAASDDTSDLRSASLLLEEAHRGVEQPDRPPAMIAVIKYGLGLVSRRLFAYDHDPLLAERAIALLGAALQADDRSRLDVADCMYEYARALLDATESSDEPDLLDEAIRTLDSLVTGSDPAAQDFAAYLDATASAHLDRFERRSARADLRIACRLAEASVACQRSRGRVSASALANLARALSARSGSSIADRDDLGSAIELIQQAIRQMSSSPAGGGRRDVLAGLRSNLVGFLLTSIERTGDLGDLDRLVELADKAVAGSRTGSPGAGTRSHQAAVAHRVRYLRFRRREDLLSALRLHRDALDAPVPPRERLALVDSFASTLRTMYDVTRDSKYLRTAIDVYEEALGATETGSPDRAGRLNNLGAAQAELASLTKDETTAMSAIRNLEEAVRHEEPHSLVRIRALINLSNAAADRATASDDPTWRRTALRYYREVQDDIGSLGQGTEAILQAALNTAELAESTQDWSLVVSISETALDAADDLLVAQGDQRSKESWLQMAVGAADRAAGAAIELDDLPAAVRMLERGRATMLREAVDQTTLDLDLLEREGGGELRRRFEDARAWVGGSHTIASGEPRRPALRALRDEIRAVPGFKSFLRPKSFAEIVAAAADGPLLYVVPGSADGAAVTVGPGGEVQHLSLRGFSADAVRQQANRLFQAHSVYTVPTGDRAARRAAAQAWHGAMEEVARWLGGVFGEPVLDMFGGGRVVIIAGGLSSVLPIHAAWWPDEKRASGRTHLLDVVEISYAPSAAALSAASRLARRLPGRRLLTVADPTPTALARLPSASAEAGVAASCRSGQGVTRLRGSSATVSAVQGALSECELLHAGCHGLADVVQPLRSGLMLANDERFTLERLLTSRTRIRLAVLSACESGRIGTALPDEVVSLPSGLIQAGAAGVVSSAWAVPDGATLALMTEFYRLWRHGAGVRPAAALAQAQAWVRDTTNGDKLASWRQRTRDNELPEDAFDALQDVYMLREADRFDDAAIGVWAPFSHVGV